MFDARKLLLLQFWISTRFARYSIHNKMRVSEIGSFSELSPIGDSERAFQIMIN